MKMSVKLLVGENISVLSRLEGVNHQVYKEKVLPEILTIVIIYYFYFIYH
jgi:hypothetical protein